MLSYPFRDIFWWSGAMNYSWWRKLKWRACSAAFCLTLGGCSGIHIQYKPRHYEQALFIFDYFLLMEIYIFNNIESYFNNNNNFLAMINISNKARLRYICFVYMHMLWTLTCIIQRASFTSAQNVSYHHHPQAFQLVSWSFNVFSCVHEFILFLKHVKWIL